MLKQKLSALYMEKMKMSFIYKWLTIWSGVHHDFEQVYNPYGKKAILFIKLNSSGSKKPKIREKKIYLFRAKKYKWICITNDLINFLYR